jgi:hypothetical protein
VTATVADKTEPDLLGEVIDGEIRDKPKGAVSLFLAMLCGQSCGQDTPLPTAGWIAGRKRNSGIPLADFGSDVPAAQG